LCYIFFHCLEDVKRGVSTCVTQDKSLLVAYSQVAVNTIQKTNDNLCLPLFLFLSFFVFLPRFLHLIKSPVHTNVCQRICHDAVITWRDFKKTKLIMLSLNVTISISIISDWKTSLFVIPCFLYLETSFNRLENTLMKTYVGFIFH
jgi:hypothetical protein